MKATLLLGLGLGFLGACGSSGGSKNPDAPGGIDDAPNMIADSPMMMPDAPPAPAMITISGQATARSLMGTAPVKNATIEAYKNSDQTTPVATTTTDMQGNFSLTISTGGVALDGYLKATASTYMDTYLYPPAPLTADFAGAAVNMLTPNNFSILSLTLCQSNQMTTEGAIAVEVVDTTGTFVQGAKLASTPVAGTYCYDANGVPNSSATATDTDGVGFMFSITGDAAVTATKTGATFKTHTVKARAGAFTTTIISE